MIVQVNSDGGKKRVAAWHDGFLAMLPSIRRHALFSFRHLDDEAREEAVAETIANALVAFKRLYDRGKLDAAYASVLARFAVAQIYSGRKVGSRLNSREALAVAAQKRHSFAVDRLDRFDNNAGEWVEATIEDLRTPVPDQAAFRCDFPVWLATQTPRNGQIAESLAIGNSTREVAQQFRVSPGRISQLRRELHDSWLEFHGENIGDDSSAADS